MKVNLPILHKPEIPRNRYPEIDSILSWQQTIHMHVNIQGKDAIVILPTIDLSTEQKTSFGYGTQISITFGGNVVHLFSKENEKNLL